MASVVKLAPDISLEDEFADFDELLSNVGDGRDQAAAA
jgi:hypothetical protein